MGTYWTRWEVQSTLHLLIFVVDTGNAVLLMKIFQRLLLFQDIVLYEWVVIPMGLMNTPAIFMGTINNLFSNMLTSSIAVSLDDILVYSGIVKEYFKLLEKVLACLC